MPGGSVDGEALLTPQILRGLGDKLYDKRKLAALEVEQLVKNLAREVRPPSCLPGALPCTSPIELGQRCVWRMRSIRPQGTTNCRMKHSGGRSRLSGRSVGAAGLLAHGDADSGPPDARLRVLAAGQLPQGRPAGAGRCRGRAGRPERG